MATRSGVAESQLASSAEATATVRYRKRMFPQIFGKYVLEREIAAGGMAWLNFCAPDSPNRMQRQASPSVQEAEKFSNDVESVACVAPPAAGIE